LRLMTTEDGTQSTDTQHNLTYCTTRSSHPSPTWHYTCL